MPVISFGKNNNPTTISLGLGTLASNSEDLLITGQPTKFYVPNNPPSTYMDITHTRQYGNMTDYVVENGKSDNVLPKNANEHGWWEWRIWASGKKELWLKAEILSGSNGCGRSVTQSGGSGNYEQGQVYRYATDLGNFPVAFNSAPKLYAFSIGDPNTASTDPWTFATIGINATTTTWAGNAYYSRWDEQRNVRLILAAYWVGDD